MSALPAARFFALVVCARRRRAETLSWSISSASFPHAQAQYRREVTQRIDDLGRVGLTRRNALDLVPDQTRIQMIGFNLMRHGERWAKANPQYMRWLSDAGVGREQAIQAHRNWHAAEMQHPFWSNLHIQ